MAANPDRPWEAPRHPWVMRMTWSKLLFAHWPVAASTVARLLPPGITLDTREGTAWVGVVPFVMSQVAPRCLPSIPGLSRFLELNVRTYVVCDGKPGVWFFSLDAENPVAVRVARRVFCLPYMDARMSLGTAAEGSIEYRSERTHRGEPFASFDASYLSTGDRFRARVGTLEHWLTARYCLYSADCQGQIYRGEIDHAPWILSQAKCEVRQNSLGEPFGLSLGGEPHLLYADPLKVRAWYPTRCWVPGQA